MKKKKNGWCKSWKSLLLVTNLLSLFLAIAHFYACFFFDFNKGSTSKLGALIGLVHLAMPRIMVAYKQNYGILVLNKVMEHTRKKLLTGLIPMILWEVFNVTVLISMLIIR